MQLEHYADETTLNEKLTQQLINILNEAIQERGQAYLAVSGGNSPKRLFQRLSKADLPWEKVTITLTDERCVHPEELESNENLIRTHLLQANAAKANFISLYCINQNANLTALPQIEKQIASLPAFDAVILGMGEDGHTASLFPCSDEITEALITSHAVAIINPKTASYQRISLTKSRLLNSKVIFLYLLGDKKLMVLNKALTGDDPSTMPIRAFLQNDQVNMKIQFAP